MGGLQSGEMRFDWRCPQFGFVKEGLLCLWLDGDNEATRVVDRLWWWSGNGGGEMVLVRFREQIGRWRWATLAF
ncbi:hypothetical protein ACLB2K_016900 [Fragaria x ananassa]